MAEAILFGLCTKILEKLGSALLQEIGSHLGVKDELARLDDTVSAVKAKLLDAEERSNQSHEVKHWLKKLKDVLYDVDDLLDAYSTKILQRNAMSGTRMTKEVFTFFSGSNQIADRVKMRRNIRSVKEKLDAIAKDMGSFNFRDQNSEPRVENFLRRETHSSIDASTSVIIGREHDKEEVIKLLSEVNENENVSTVAVVGLGGLGKTTLAQLVFNDKDFSSAFELKIWVYVSEIFDVKTIAQKISSSGNSDMETLQQEVRKKIDGKKYLLVLDDLWNEDHEDWLKLKTLLVGGARGSRILVTTRSAKVAASTRSFRSHELKGLNEDGSWSLFNKMVIGERNESEFSKFQDIGREIVKNCVGVPLTIRSIGRVLYDQTAESEWLRVRNGFANVNASIREDLKILKLSYDHLPSHLKQCFGYCSLYPKGYEFKKKELIQLWIAQGFVQSSGDYQHLEDAGDKYISELLWRSFFQEASKDGAKCFPELRWSSSFHEAINAKFTMHDLMCDLARFVAGTECSISDQVVDERTRHVSRARPSGSSSVLPSGFLKAKSMRTLIFPYGHYGDPLNLDLDTIFSTFRCLRALDLSRCELKSLPHSIGKLKHLRYLDISRNGLIEKLPSSIVKLQNLQTLKLSRCHGLLELPSEITKIPSLRHIEIDRCTILERMPLGLGQLTSLQTLSLFVVDNSWTFASRQGAGLCELNKLNNLRGKLRIDGLENVATASNDDHSYLKEKKYLNSLTLAWNTLFHNEEDEEYVEDSDMLLEALQPHPNIEEDVEDSDMLLEALQPHPNIEEDEEYVENSDMLLEALQPHPNLKKLQIWQFGGLKIPNWISSLPNLVSIVLHGCRRWQHIPKLDNLSCLRKLCLDELPALEYISSEIFDSVATFFPSLEMLKLRNCEKLRGWWGAIDVEVPQFKRLSRLEILNCPNLTSMPLFPFLEYLKLENASQKPLQETVKMLKKNMAVAPSRMSTFAVSGVEDLKSHLDQWLQCFPSLRTLYIADCPGLAFLPPHLKHLCSLKELRIHNAEDLDPSRDNNGEDFQWQLLTSLVELRLSGLPKMVALPSALQHVTILRHLNISSSQTLKDLPEWLPNLTSLVQLRLSWLPKMVALPSVLQHVTTLRYLGIEGCSTLKSLPEWLSNLNALDTLDLRCCRELKSMPDGMPRLTSLRRLFIMKCGKLSKRCRRNKGKDWPKIAHVHYIFVDGERI